MNELDLILQIQEARANIALVLSLVFTMLSVMVVATHYFLGKKRFLVRFSVFVIFTVGYLALLSLYQWEIIHVRAVLNELNVLAEIGALSKVGVELLAWSGGPASIQAWLPNVMFFVGWVLVGVFLFFFDHKTANS